MIELKVKVMDPKTKVTLKMKVVTMANDLKAYLKAYLKTNLRTNQNHLRGHICLPQDDGFQWQSTMLLLQLALLPCGCRHFHFNKPGMRLASCWQFSLLTE